MDEAAEGVESIKQLGADATRSVVEATAASRAGQGRAGGSQTQVTIRAAAPRTSIVRAASHI